MHAISNLADASSLDERALLDVVLDAKLRQMAPTLRRWYDDAALRDNLRPVLAAEARRVFDDELAEEYRASCALPGTTTADVRNRWLALPEFGHALVGIRFERGDLAKPFIDVIVTTEPLRTVAQFRAVCAPLARPFASFAPTHVQHVVPSPVALDLTALGSGAAWKQRFLAAPVVAMRPLPFPSGYERVALTVPPDLDFYPRYAAVYEQLHAQRPAHREYAWVETREDLAEYSVQDALVEVLIGGRWAGLVAGFRAEEQGLCGFVVGEIVLAREFRGQGLGTAVQRRFVEALPTEEGDVLSGTIHADNRAAIATAKRCGREDIGGSLWLALP